MSKKIIGYYQFDKEEFSIALVLKEFWEKHKFLDDSASEEEFVPEGFYELAEAIYEHTFGSTQEAKDVLNKAGWSEAKLFAL